MSELFPEAQVTQRMVQVAHEDILDAVEETGDWKDACPVQKAIGREVTCRVSVTQDEIIYLDAERNEITRAWLPDNFRELVYRFDNGEECELCSGLVWMPTEHLREEL